MKSVGLLLMTAALSWSQGVRPSLKIAPSTFSTLEKSFDTRVEKTSADPMVILGTTRGLYIEGYGAVFTTEVDLIQTPNMMFMRSSPMTPEEVARVHERKLRNITALKSAMTEMMKAAGRTLLQIPPDQKLVVAVRLLYLPWENTAGLPSQFVLSATRTGAVDGAIKVDEQ
jgi:hypothetical protein